LVGSRRADGDGIRGTGVGAFVVLRAPAPMLPMQLPPRAFVAANVMAC
jgi:hypothetical protein